LYLQFKIENYVSVRPATLSGSTKSQRDCSHLQLLAAAADSIVASDRIGRLIRTSNNWSLLPAQAVFATVIPGERLHGSIGLPAFPAWFGKNSKQGRVDRILQELQKHMRMHISANKVFLFYCFIELKKKINKETSNCN
jgi:replication factor C subunit 1